MKVRFLIVVLSVFLLQGCSWIIRFFVVNTTNESLVIELNLLKNPSSFPIFHYREFYLYEGSGKKINWEKQKEIVPDTLENYAHLKMTLPANSTLEIGRLNNDKYERHDQYFINGRVFNLEELNIYKEDDEIEITPATFDNYFKKGKNGEVFYFVK